MEVSNNLLAVLVIVAMAVSIAGTSTMLSLVPGVPVRITGGVPSAAGTAQANIQAEVNLQLDVATVDFGTLSPGGTAETWDYNPHPFVVINNGSVPINVSVAVSGSNLWGSTWNDGNFTVNASDNVTVGSSYIILNDGSPEASSLKPMMNTSQDSVMLVYNLSSDVDQDHLDIQMYVSVPPDENAGGKSCTVLFNASQG